MSNGFRPNAGVVILGESSQVLAFRRRGTQAWQFPQGGIDPGEEPGEAMWRELAEETGLGPDHVELVAELPEWIGYEIPPEFRKRKFGRGQVQRWFFVRVRDGELDAVERLLDQLPPEEFDGWKWTTMADVTAEVIAFREPVYRRLTDFLAGL